MAGLGWGERQAGRYSEEIHYSEEQPLLVKEDTFITQLHNANVREHSSQLAWPGNLELLLSHVSLSHGEINQTCHVSSPFLPFQGTKF